MSGLTWTPDSRAAMIEQAFRLEYITLAWMVVEAAVAFGSGIVAGSLALTYVRD